MEVSPWHGNLKQSERSGAAGFLMQAGFSGEEVELNDC
jgi:hypothetical protein